MASRALRFVVVLVGAGAVLATAAHAAKPHHHRHPTASPTTPYPYFECERDADCVAITNPACCASKCEAYDVAVNRNFTKEYVAHHNCTAPYPPCPFLPACPTYERVPICTSPALKCEMVSTWAIPCDGFTALPHKW